MRRANCAGGRFDDVRLFISELYGLDWHTGWCGGTNPAERNTPIPPAAERLFYLSRVNGRFAAFVSFAP
ncbi:MAG: hypothetical protein QOG73_3414 [Acetobacteraceae bacterium]|jgi:hypothetical protein|nr:hypothetical protein [Acetobacteraceae bacterium]